MNQQRRNISGSDVRVDVESVTDRLIIGSIDMNRCTVYIYTIQC